MTPDVGKSIGTVFLATTDWIVRYWVDRLGREPADGELEPLTRAYLERSRTISGGRFLQAVETCQRFGRTVARFLAGFDAWLTPTMSTLPLPIGEITSTNDDPWRAARNGWVDGGFRRRRREHHWQPGDVGPDALDRRRFAGRRALPGPVR